MGSPAWDKIPFDKLPQWKKEEMLSKAKKTVKTLETDIKNQLTCDICGKEAKSIAGSMSHKRSHK